MGIHRCVKLVNKEKLKEDIYKLKTGLKIYIKKCH